MPAATPLRVNAKWFTAVVDRDLSPVQALRAYCACEISRRDDTAVDPKTRINHVRQWQAPDQVLDAPGGYSSSTPGGVLDGGRSMGPHEALRRIRVAVIDGFCREAVR